CHRRENVMIVDLLVLTVLLTAPVAKAIPRRGNEPWSLILCKFRDYDYEPRTAEWFSEWISGGNNPDTIESYFSSVSNAIYTIKGSNVTRWIRLPWRRREVLRMAMLDPRLQSVRERPFAMFDKTKQLCISFAQQSGFVLHKNKITIINTENTAVYGKDTGVLLTPKLIFSSVLTHEMIHSMNIGHSYSDRKTRIFPYSEPGEYDDKYDLMSTANAHMRPSTYGLSGPGLNGPHLDYLGWLPQNRMVYFGRDGRSNYTLRLSSLSVPHRLTIGWLLVMIPYDRDDPGNVYTVEYRTPVGNDAAIRQGAVVIHKVHRVGNSYYSTLVTHERGEYNELTLGTEWLKFLDIAADGSFQYIRVKVERVHGKSHSTDLKIMTTFRPEVCRGADVQMPVERTSELVLHGVRSVCIERNRTVTQRDVDQQYLRNSFFQMRKTFGQNECKVGRIWRGIDAYDYVCVEPHRADEVVDSVVSIDDIDAGCDVDYVHRNAFQGDKACVSEDERALVHKENAESHLNLRSYAFFNGADSVGL
uniref:Reprolysin n=1 Tax=Haemonchus contortus TaxID=6289 RepID=A0A7I4Y4F0_HAECO